MLIMKHQNEIINEHQSIIDLTSESSTRVFIFVSFKLLRFYYLLT